MQVEKDPVTGRNTTGHEWDGIKELDNPVPWAAKWALRLTVLFSLGYWVLYPAFPMVSDFTRGALGYNSREVVLAKVEASTAERAEVDADLLAGDLETLAADPEVRAHYEAPASVLYRDNCAMCHGPDLKGQAGFPNLIDDHWLWAGDLEDIESTLQVGINSGHEDEQIAEMLAFGTQGMLEKPDIKAVVEHVLAIAGKEHDADLASAGAAVFEENCSACHSDDGEGGLKNGAPSLIDQAWIYGGDRKSIHRSIWAGRKGVMPAWSGRLSEADIRKLALYVHWQGKDDD